eukprot:jgi/Mesvir1/18969/Mv18936-RA.1
MPLLRCTFHGCKSRTATHTTTKALFGWGQKKEEQAEQPKKMDRRERQRLEMIEAMKQKVADRRAGNKQSRAEVAERRAKVTQYLRDPEVKKAVDDERRERTQQMKGPEAPNFGIIVPMAPFGIPEYDNGERFDLALPHVDEGYVDEDADVPGYVQRCMVTYGPHMH